jgi:hypothetical protein
VADAWSTTPCGGGVKWCPTSGNQTPYKNAITNQLFLSAAMVSTVLYRVREVELAIPQWRLLL